MSQTETSGVDGGGRGLPTQVLGMCRPVAPAQTFAGGSFRIEPEAIPAALLALNAARLKLFKISGGSSRLSSALSGLYAAGPDPVSAATLTAFEARQFGVDGALFSRVRGLGASIDNAIINLEQIQAAYANQDGATADSLGS